MLTKKEIEESDFLSKAVLHYRPDGQPVWNIQFLLKEPEIHIETDPETVVGCPFLKRETLLALEEFQEFRTFKPIDFTTDGVLLSYKWEGKDNPDASGNTLQFIKEYLYNNPSIPGVFVDYMCLPQAPRTDSQRQIFNNCLKAMNVWYTSYPTISFTFDERYFNSSWCICESMLSHHSQQMVYVSHTLDSHALMIKFIGNQLHQKCLVSETAIKRVCAEYNYELPSIDVDLSMGTLAQSVLAQIMLRIANSHATNGSDKTFIVEIMRAFTSVTRLFVSDVFPVRGIIEDIRFEKSDIIGIMDNGIEVRYSEFTTNPRDTIMGLTVMRKNMINRDLSYLFI